MKKDILIQHKKETVPNSNVHDFGKLYGLNLKSCVAFSLFLNKIVRSGRHWCQAVFFTKQN